jgi:hypothetical protein
VGGRVKYNQGMTDDLSKIRQMVEGKRVVSVESNGEKLVLDDGTVLHLYESNSDCCASARGDWVIQPDALDAIITDVKIDVLAQNEGNGDGSESHATITILHNQNPVALGDCYANDGNGGYYYAALSLNVLVPDSDEINVQVVDA